MDGIVVRFYEEARRAADLGELNLLFRREARASGFTAYAAGPLVPFDIQDPFLLLDWPLPWLQLYAAKGFAQEDVCLREAVHSPKSFTWAEVQSRHPGASERVFAAAASFGWRNGFTVPVHGPGQERGVFSLAGPDPQLRENKPGIMEAIALCAYERARELRSGCLAGASPLTSRETQALALVGGGKSDAEIGAFLNIARTTAHFHVESAKRKLGAATRAHAVAIGLIRGFILL